MPPPTVVFTVAGIVRHCYAQENNAVELPVTGIERSLLIPLAE
jgi:hypothetical protein